MILQTLLFVLLRYKMSVWELLNMKSCCEYRKKGFSCIILQLFCLNICRWAVKRVIEF